MFQANPSSYRCFHGLLREAPSGGFSPQASRDPPPALSAGSPLGLQAAGRRPSSPRDTLMRPPPPHIPLTRAPQPSCAGHLSLVLCAGPQTTGPSSRFLRSQANTRPPLGKGGSQHRPPPQSHPIQHIVPPTSSIQTGSRAVKMVFTPWITFPVNHLWVSSQCRV